MMNVINSSAEYGNESMDTIPCAVIIIHQVWEGAHGWWVYRRFAVSDFSVAEGVRGVVTESVNLPIAVYLVLGINFVFKISRKLRIV